MEKPILFNTEMVKAILEGRKTTTRRIIKDVNNLYFLGFNSDNFNATFSDEKLLNDATFKYRKPPCYVGDILYVRETWMMQSMSNYDKKAKFLFKAEPNQELKEVILSNDRYENLIKYSYKNGWQPSLFMPKEAARIFLKVKDVRIERLQDITEEGALTEGCISTLKLSEDHSDYTGLYARENFAKLWNGTLKQEQLKIYEWNANPYVWVIEFEITKK